MQRLCLKQLDVELHLTTARTRADDCLPFSPSWAAAIEQVEDLERQLWVLGRMIGQPERFLDVPRDRAIEPYRQPQLALAAAH